MKMGYQKRFEEKLDQSVRMLGEIGPWAEDAHKTIKRALFGEALRDWRDEKNLTLRKAAELTGMVHSHLAGLTTGRITLAEETLLALRDKAGLDEGFLRCAASRPYPNVRILGTATPANATGLSEFFKAAGCLSPDQWTHVTDFVKKLKLKQEEDKPEP